MSLTSCANAEKASMLKSEGDCIRARFSKERSSQVSTTVNDSFFFFSEELGAAVVEFFRKSVYNKSCWMWNTFENLVLFRYQNRSRYLDNPVYICGKCSYLWEKLPFCCFNYYNFWTNIRMNCKSLS